MRLLRCLGSIANLHCSWSPSSGWVGILFFRLVGERPLPKTTDLVSTKENLLHGFPLLF